MYIYMHTYVHIHQTPLCFLISLFLNGAQPCVNLTIEKRKHDAKNFSTGLKRKKS